MDNKQDYKKPKRGTKMIKKALTRKIRTKIALVAAAITAVLVLFLVFISMLSALLGGAAGGSSQCETDDETEVVANGSGSTSSGFASIDEFVKQHEEAYIESWGVGGFLPSASIAQTMQEVSFSMSVPSFGQAHNMGGVKAVSSMTYPKTKELYGSDAVGGGPAGTGVGDGAGTYAYFKDFDAGIVGKAEFMSAQTLYTKAINNTDGKATLNAIADGGWAEDPNYKVALNNIYDNLGAKYKWLDQKAIERYGETPFKGVGKSSAISDDSGDDDDDDESYHGDTSKIDVDGVIGWYENRLGKVTYSMSERTGPNSYDCSSSLYFALTDNGANKTDGNYPVSTESEHDWLASNGYQKVYEGNWSSDKEVQDIQRGDIFIWGKKGESAGSLGHTGIFTSEKEIIHCSYGNNGIQKNEYNSYKDSVPDHGTVYIYRLGGSDGGEDADECGDSGDDEDAGEDAVDGTGKVPSDATAWGYEPKDLPASLKKYYHNPEDVGMAYKGPSGWLEHSGQCVDLVESYGGYIWLGHSQLVVGNGWQQASGWASTIFHNEVKTVPKAGAIFSTNVAANHTGIVLHVFEDGSCLIVEQNTPYSGADYFHVKDTWNYRVVRTETQKQQGWTFAYPDGNKTPNWKK